MFVDLRDEAAAALEAALAAAGYPTEDLGLEEPPEDVDAVLASSVAFRLAGEAGAPPPAVAADLADGIDLTGATYVDRVETQGPYLNFHASGAYRQAALDLREDAGVLPPTGESVVVEHTSANPTGPVHVGRARNPIIGDAVANLLDHAGHDVERHYYVNDAGRQIAVFAWAYERFEETDLPEEPARDRADYDLVRYYRHGNRFLEGELPEATPEAIADAEAEIDAILQGLEAGDEDAYERVSEVVDAVLGGMRDCLDRLPARFDEFVKETRFMRDGSTDDVVAQLKATDAAVFEEDAWQLDLDEYGIGKNLVFLRSDGTSLYTTRDLAHHEWKFANFDRAVTVLGEDHKLQADQLRAALDLLGEEPDRLDHVIYSYVNLPEGKMSTRAGTAVNLDDLLDEAVARAREEVEMRIADETRAALSEAEIDRIARQVGVGAVRYDIVAKQPSKGITFEWERALDFEAQSAPYVQYVHARCRGILDEAEKTGLAVPEPGEADAGALSADEAVDLVETVARFSGVVESAAADLEPHRVATYTRELAEAFNAFYRECPVLDAAGDRREARLAAVAATRHAVANALGVLGVAAPDSM